MPPTTTNLSFSQLEALWTQAGGSASLAPVMAAIALAESSGNPNALNPIDNGGTQSSYGLWQISDGTHAEPSPNWATPSVNAQLAVAKLSSQGLGAWGTYDSGAYLQYLPGGAGNPGQAQLTSATASNTGAGGTSILPGVPGTAPPAPSLGLNPITDLGNVFGWATQFGAWAMFVFIILLFGMILLGLGILMLVVLLAAPVASPVADVVGGGIVGRATKGVARSARSSASSGGARASRPSPTAEADAQIARARHGPARGGARPRGGTVQARHAIAEHNRQEEGYDRFVRTEARASDRRNRVGTEREARRQPASSTSGRRRSIDASPGRRRAR